MSIATAITAAQNKVAAAYTSCNNMGATMPAPAGQDLSHLPATIESIPRGTAPVSPKDVNFYDYDGTCLYAYSKADFLALPALPSNPSHTGLTAQGWNWTLAQAQTYVTTYGKLNIGQMYVTDDGKTRLYITIAAEGRMTVPLFFRQTVSGGVTIDWGDGSAAETVSGTGGLQTSHTYSAIGNYTITMTVTSGKLQLAKDAYNTCVMGTYSNDTRVYLNMLTKVELGTNAGLSNWAFLGCLSLRTITIASGATYGFNMFQECSALLFCVMPDTWTTMSGAIFSACRSLRGIAMPPNFTTLANNFAYNCTSLADLTIPSATTNLSGAPFWGDYALATLTIPSGVTNIANNSFTNCYGLKSVYVYPTTPPTAGTTIFSGCPSDMVIYVPNGKLTTYQGASNWSAYSSQMVEMPA